jgi:amino acid transporter
MNSTILFAYLLILLCCIIIKFIFWLRIKKGISYYLKSFFRWYNHHAFVMNDSDKRERFMLASNIINFIWFVASIILIIMLVLLRLLGVKENLS